MCTFGSLYFITLKKRTDMSSAMELQEVGWPDLLAKVIRTEWMRSLVARSRRTDTSSTVGWWYKFSPDITPLSSANKIQVTSV